MAARAALGLVASTSGSACAGADIFSALHGLYLLAANEGVAVNLIQRQLGHTDLGTTSTYLQGIDPSEIIDAACSRRQPTITTTAGLTL